MSAIQFGSGKGLSLDGELWHCTSQNCDTFENEPLHGNTRDIGFEAIAVEVFGFQKL